MPQRNKSIRRKLMTIILLISGVVSLLTCAAFSAYEILTFRRSLLAIYTIRSQIVAANSTAALAFTNETDAVEVLSALKADPHVSAAGLYDRNGKLFARYPARLPDSVFPPAPGQDGFRFEHSHLVAFNPVVQGDKRLGTLYLQSDLTAMSERFQLYAVIVVLVMAVSFAVAYLLSRTLQKQISEPILSLAETARAISERHDYSVRAAKLSDDELGRLTDAFNQMLGQIQHQNQTLKQNEIQLQTIIENLGEGLAVSDLNGQLLHFNRAALELHGFTSLDECHQHLTKFAEIFELSTMDGTVLPLADWPLARILRGEQLCDLEVRIRRPGSDWQRVFSYGGTLVHNPDGKPMMAVVTISDITERKRAAAEILQLNTTLERRVTERTAQLEAANKELEAFSYSVSHDLRAPLRHIDGFAGLLVKSDGQLVSEQGRGYLAHISDSAKQMGVLIDDLLVFSQMARSEMSIGQVDLQKLMEETIRALQTEIQQRNIRWQKGFLPVMPGDRSMLRQVFVNLLANAVKYTRPRDPAEIEIGCRDESAEEVVVYVRDNGVGFEMEYAHKLFGVFQRLHRAEDFEGTGIGLANIRRIITRHGGRTWAEGKPDAGATFYFSLPKHRRKET